MATIVVSTVSVDEVDTPSTEVVQLQILVKREDYEDLFTQIEVWRSRSSIQGPYEELTADGWRAARIPKLADDRPAAPVTGRTVPIVGLTLELRVQEQDDIVITFTGVDTLTFAAAADQITAQGLSKVVAYVDGNGLLVVETTEPGTGAVLRITGGDAAPLLGLPLEEPDSLAFGRDARIPLKVGTESYLFTDVRGSDAYYYKTRFRNPTTQGVSAFSQPFSLGQALGISAANVVCGTLDLVDTNGRPLANREVVVFNQYQGDLVEGKFVAGFGENRLTDENGHVEFTLVRGSYMTVAVSGTDVARNIVVPTDENVKIFGLLDSDVSTQDDGFVVQVPSIIYAERRSL
jgi:hypothetical protein